MASNSAVNVVRARDEPLGEQEAEDELVIVARRAHRDRDGFAGYADLQRLFRGDLRERRCGRSVSDEDDITANALHDLSRLFQASCRRTSTTVA